MNDRNDTTSRILKRSILMMVALLAIAVLAGCATTDYADQLATYRQVEVARATADSERYRALAAIAQGASEGTRQTALQAWQAVAMTEAFRGGGGDRPALPLPPPTPMDRAMQALQAFAPFAVQAYGLHTGYRLGIRQSDNSTAVALGEQRARVDGLLVFGHAMQGLGSAGFGAMRDTTSVFADSLTALANRPTTAITVTGNDNAVATGGSATRTDTRTNNCNAYGGNGGTSGNTGSGGAGSASATGSTASGGSAGNSGAPGAAGQASVSCTTTR